MSTDRDLGDYTDWIDAVADKFNALDEWLSSGGFLPDAWQTNR